MIRGQPFGIAAGDFIESFWFIQHQQGVGRETVNQRHQVVLRLTGQPDFRGRKDPDIIALTNGFLAVDIKHAD